MAEMPIARERWFAIESKLARLPAWVDALVLAAFCVALAMYVFGISPANLDVPLLSAGDGGSAQFIMKTVLEHGWYTQNPDVGAPFEATMYDYPIPEPTHLVLIRALGVFGNDPALVFNLFYLLSFATTSIAAWWAFRFIGADRCMAFAGAFLFTMLPYHFLRLGHVYLASYFAVPIFAAFAVRLALYRAPHIGGELRLTLGALVLIALAAGGGVYYAFFGCLLIATGAALGAIRSRRIEPLAIGGACVAVTAAVIAAALVPNWLYQWHEGANPLVGNRVPSEVEYLGLRITQMLLPNTLHHFGPLRALTAGYNARTPLINENMSVALGLVGALGLVASLAIALSAWRDRFPRVAAFGTLSLVCILFATLGGFGSLFALLVTPELRGLNRISVCIAFFAIAAFFFLARRALRAHPLAFALVALVAIPVGACDEIPLTIRLQPAPFRAREAFFDRIEATLPQGTAVFELPWMYFPEAPKTEKLMSYDLFEPYLRTRGLRWSFGDMHGRAADLWTEQASTLHGEQLVAALAGAGFGAVYLDRRGYADRGAAVERELAAVLGAPVLEDAARDVAVYRIAAERAPRVPFVVVGAGRNWSPWTGDAKTGLAGSATRAATDLVVANPGAASELEVSFALVSAEKRHVAVRYGDRSLGAYELAPGKPQAITVRFLAAPGVSRLAIDSEDSRASANPPYRLTKLEYGPPA